MRFIDLGKSWFFTFTDEGGVVRLMYKSGVAKAQEVADAPIASPATFRHRSLYLDPDLSVVPVLASNIAKKFAELHPKRLTPSRTTRV